MQKSDETARGKKCLERTKGATASWNTDRASEMRREDDIRDSTGSTNFDFNVEFMARPRCASVVRYETMRCGLFV